MNIFLLSTDPAECAQMHADKHVGKMLLESCQILSTVLSFDLLEDQQEFIRYFKVVPYKPTHLNHPCIKWAAKSYKNASWLSKLAKNLALEFRFRFEKEHGSEQLALAFARDHSYVAPQQQDFCCCVPEEYHPLTATPTPEQVVSAYRTYYQLEKRHLLQYTKRQPPSWIESPLAIWKINEMPK
jgi:hypothetical protein